MVQQAFRLQKDFDQGCSKFKSALFNKHLSNAYAEYDPHHYHSFKNLLIHLLKEHALLKKKVIKANTTPYISEGFMRISFFEKKHCQKKIDHLLMEYRHQKNYTSRLYKRPKKIH